MQEQFDHRETGFSKQIAFNSQSPFTAEKILELEDIKGGSFTIEQLPSGRELNEAQLMALSRKLFLLYIRGFMQEEHMGDEKKVASFFDDLREHLWQSAKHLFDCASGCYHGLYRKPGFAD